MKLWIKRMFVSNSAFQMFPMKLKLLEKKNKKPNTFFFIFYFLIFVSFCAVKKIGLV